VIPDEELVANTIERILADKGYRDHNAPPDYKFRVFLSGQKRGVTPSIKRAAPQSRRRARHRPSPSRTPNTAWAANISGPGAAMPTTPSSPPSVTTSAALSDGLDFCCAKSWPSSSHGF
jgi:hypothetical protein